MAPSNTPATQLAQAAAFASKTHAQEIELLKNNVKNLMNEVETYRGRLAALEKKVG